MIWAWNCIFDRCNNLTPQGNCVKLDIGQIFGIDHATYNLVNSLQYGIFLWIFYSGACRFDRKSLSNGIKFLLNSDPLSKIIFPGLGYLDSHTSLNIWDIMVEYWWTIGISAISNHPVSGSIKVVHNNWSSFIIIVLSGYLNLYSIAYVTMKSTHTVCHGVNISVSLSGRNPYLSLRF